MALPSLLHHSAFRTLAKCAVWASSSADKNILPRQRFLDQFARNPLPDVGSAWNTPDATERGVSGSNCKSCMALVCLFNKTSLSVRGYKQAFR